MAKYPQRDPFYAHQVVRRMTHVCAAQEIGSDAFVLITVVAHTEDAKRYTGPVTWWNSQLQSVLGFGSWDKVDRARKRAVKAGWLHYEPGGKGKVGKYWATIPEQYADIPDGPVDADEPIILRTGAETNHTYPHQGDAPVRKETGDKLDTSPEHLIPKPKPKPKPKNTSCSERPQAADSKPTDPLVILTYPVAGKGKTSWNLTQAKLDEYAESFPGVDVLAECRKALQWCRDYPKKRKTHSGMAGFLSSWLGRTQNRGGGSANQTPGPGQAVRRSGRVHERDYSQFNTNRPPEASGTKGTDRDSTQGNSPPPESG